MIGPLLRNELRMLLRDTRTLLIAVVAPIVVLPGWILVSNFVADREEERIESATYRWALVGEEAAWGESIIERALDLPADSTLGDATFERVGEGNDSLLSASEVELVVVARRATEADSLATDTPVLEVRYRAESDLSRAARERFVERLEAVREAERDRRFRLAGLPASRAELGVVSTTNVASAGKEGGRLLSRFLLPFVVMMMLGGGSIMAADTISGEKERGTLETLLTSSARRSEIVRAKLLAVITVGLAVVVINVVNLAIYVTIGVFDLPEGLALELAPAQLALLLLLFLPLAGLVAAGLLLVSGIAKSYREYQLYAPVLFLAFLIPSLAGLLPGLSLESAIVLVPLAGVAVATTAVLVDAWHPLWGLVAFASSAGAALYLLRRVEGVLSNERLIAGTDFDEAEFRGGPALFPRHVLTWFLGLWVLFFLASLWFGDVLGVRGQLVINLVGIFLGGSAWMVHRYRLDPVEVLSLRRPRWTAWPAVLIGAPSFLVLGVGVSELVNTWLFPMPESVLESFARGLTLDLGLAQIVFFLAILPGVLEEIAFRGVLLHGLRRRLRTPWAAALACGVIFGLFHVSLFRIIPTGLLGIVLALVVLRTGSIYPAMLWHLLNNALALVPDELGWISPDLAVPGWAYALAFVGMAISLSLLRPRTPGAPRAPSPVGGVPPGGYSP
ncbi:MAG: ABC transporter permease subunit [Longimicrobiales bacterium]|nr:ABC transporter permease subunit [Longimicrobiales bacterium]